MALAELLAAFERDTDAEIRAIRAAGDAEAARIVMDGDRARSARVAAATTELAAEQRAAHDRELGAARRRVRADVLVARAAMLERARAAVLALLPDVFARDARLRDTALAAALASAGEDPGVLRCAPAVVDAARASAPSTLAIVADDGVTTGARVELASGTTIDATLTGLLEREWPRLACEALTMGQR